MDVSTHFEIKFYIHKDGKEAYESIATDVSAAWSRIINLYLLI